MENDRNFRAVLSSMVLELKSSVFVQKTDFRILKIYVFSEITFFQEKKAPAAKLSHKQSKFSKK